MHTLISSTPYNEGGEFVGYQGTVQDITEKVRATEEIKRRANQLEALREVGLNLVSELDLDDLLENIVTHAVDLVDGTRGSFSVLDPHRDVLNLDVHVGYESLAEDTTFVQGEGLIGNVWAKKEAILVEDYAAWEGHAPSWVNIIGHRAIMGVSVMWGGEMLGVIEVQREPGNPFSEEEAQLLELFAHQAAIAVHNANLFNQAGQRLKRLRSLHEIERIISGAMDLAVTMNVLIDRLIRTLEVDAGAILLYQPALQELEFVTGSGFRTEAIQDTRVRLGEGQAGRVALEREIVHVPDLTLETAKFERVKLCRQEGFKSYFGVPLIAKGDIVGVLEVFHSSLLDPSDEWVDFLETLAEQAAIAINDAQLFEDLQRSNLELTRAYDSTLGGWAKALELKDQETEGHARRVIEMTMALAERMGVGKEKLPHIRRGALLHDIGKMGIPDHVLQKKGSLDEKERALIEKHPQYAYNLLSDIDYLQPVLDIPYCHHEKWDGTGYPRGLKGEEIPFAARIFAVVDVWDALTSDRPYRDAWSRDKAINYIKEQAGKYFDPNVVKVFLEMMES